MSFHLESNRYGKHSVRISKVRRPRNAPANQEQHEFVEVAVDVELEGDFGAAYTAADNRSIIATDTLKNIVYVVAKDDPLETIEAFGIAISKTLLTQYRQISSCRVTLRQREWSRLQNSPFCFSGREASQPVGIVSQQREAQPMVTSGIEKLLIAKSTESGFASFHRDEFRTLGDTDDRILATELSANWTYSTPNVDFAAGRVSVIEALLARFADHYSHSLQETLYRMGAAALTACPQVCSITLNMPNKHHILCDLAPFGRDNENEIFVVTDTPFGYITGTIRRDPSS